jgi:NADPH:quinone reductase-like Zn-dependent oxidoreductase
MRALVSSSTPPGIEIGDVPDPTPRHDEALVEVKAISLNRGEIKRLQSTEPGVVIGWDLAGVVAEAAGDGSGPAAGTPVVGLKQRGAWAERAAVRTEWLAELPDGISFEQAAALPVAGLTALLALEIGGFIVGKRVLVSGASGGVGRFALQLAKLAGAHVTAVARRTDGLTELGADEVQPELDAQGPEFDVIIDAIGGPVLAAAIQRIKPRGTIVNFAATVPEPVSYPTREFFSRAPGAVLRGLYVFSELEYTRSGSRDLRRLADLVAAGLLDPQIDVTAQWTEAEGPITALLERRVNGKAVLTLD